MVLTLLRFTRSIWNLSALCVLPVVIAGLHCKPVGGSLASVSQGLQLPPVESWALTVSDTVVNTARWIMLGLLALEQQLYVTLSLEWILCWLFANKKLFAVSVWTINGLCKSGLCVRYTVVIDVRDISLIFSAFFTVHFDSWAVQVALVCWAGYTGARGRWTGGGALRWNYTSFN